MKLMLESVKKHDPEEACGLLIGKSDQVYMVVPVTNTLHSPTRFKMDPHEQLAAFNLMEEQKMELLGIYHSHPNGPEVPSVNDIAESFYPEAVQIIWSKHNRKWYCRAFCIKSGQVTKANLNIINS